MFVHVPIHFDCIIALSMYIHNWPIHFGCGLSTCQSIWVTDYQHSYLPIQLGFGLSIFIPANSLGLWIIYIHTCQSIWVTDYLCSYLPIRFGYGLSTFTPANPFGLWVIHIHTCQSIWVMGYLHVCSYTYVPIHFICKYYCIINVPTCQSIWVAGYLCTFLHLPIHFSWTVLLH